MTAQVGHPSFEGGSGARRGRIEQRKERLVAQQWNNMVFPVFLAEAACETQSGLKLLNTPVLGRYQVSA
jgi:hypothetical protein